MVLANSLDATAKWAERQKKKRAKRDGESYEEPPKEVMGFVATAKATKFAALFADLKALREAEPAMRCVIFTEQYVRPAPHAGRALHAWRPCTRLRPYGPSLLRATHVSKALSPPTVPPRALRRDRTQDNLVRLMQEQAARGGLLEGLLVFEFNKDTPPLRRHKLIKDFQEVSAR